MISKNIKTALKKGIAISLASAAMLGGVVAVNNSNANNTFDVANENLKESGVEQNWGVFFADNSSLELLDDEAVDVAFRIYAPDQAALQAVGGTGIRVVVGAPNDIL